MFAVRSPCVPRIGEIVEPEKGEQMEVVGVSHVMMPNDDPLDDRKRQLRTLVPHVLLKPIDDPSEA